MSEENHGLSYHISIEVKFAEQMNAAQKAIKALDKQLDEFSAKSAKAGFKASDAAAKNIRKARSTANAGASEEATRTTDLSMAAAAERFKDHPFVLAQGDDDIKKLRAINELLAQTEEKTKGLGVQQAKTDISKTSNKNIKQQALLNSEKALEIRANQRLSASALKLADDYKVLSVAQAQFIKEGKAYTLEDLALRSGLSKTRIKKIQTLAAKGSVPDVTESAKAPSSTSVKQKSAIASAFEAALRKDRDDKLASEFVNKQQTPVRKRTALGELNKQDSLQTTGLAEEKAKTDVLKNQLALETDMASLQTTVNGLSAIETEAKRQQVRYTKQQLADMTRVANARREKGLNTVEDVMAETGLPKRRVINADAEFRASDATQRAQTESEKKAAKDRAIARRAEADQKRLANEVARQRREAEKAAVAQGFFGSHASRALFTFRRLIGIMAVFQLARNIAGGIGAAAKEAIRFNSELETSRISLAAIIAGTGQIKMDGRPLSGVEEYRAGLVLADDVIKQLRMEAFKTVATFEDLMNAYNMAAGPALAAGFDTTQIVKFSTDIAKTAMALKVPSNQFGEEIRSLINGTISLRNTRLSMIGVTNEQLRQAKQEGRLFEYLTDKMAAFAIASDDVVKTFAGLRSNIWDVVQGILQMGTANLFEEMKTSMMAFYSALINQQAMLQGGENMGINPAAIAGVQELGDALAEGLKSFREFVDADNVAEGFQESMTAIANLIRATTPAVQVLVTAFAKGVVIVSRMVNAISTMKDALLSVVPDAIEGLFKNILTYILSAGAALLLWNNTVGTILIKTVKLAMAMTAINTASKLPLVGSLITGFQKLVHYGALILSQFVGVGSVMTKLKNIAGALRIAFFAIAATLTPIVGAAAAPWVLGVTAVVAAVAGIIFAVRKLSGTKVDNPYKDLEESMDKLKKSNLSVSAQNSKFAEELAKQLDEIKSKAYEAFLALRKFQLLKGLTGQAADFFAPMYDSLEASTKQLELVTRDIDSLKKKLASLQTLKPKNLTKDVTATGIATNPYDLEQLKNAQRYLDYKKKIKDVSSFDQQLTQTNNNINNELFRRKEEQQGTTTNTNNTQINIIPNIIPPDAGRLEAMFEGVSETAIQAVADKGKLLQDTINKSLGTSFGLSEAIDQLAAQNDIDSQIKATEEGIVNLEKDRADVINESTAALQDTVRLSIERYKREEAIAEKLTAQADAMKILSDLDANIQQANAMKAKAAEIQLAALVQQNALRKKELEYAQEQADLVKKPAARNNTIATAPFTAAIKTKSETVGSLVAKKSEIPNTPANAIERDAITKEIAKAEEEIAALQWERVKASLSEQEVIAQNLEIAKANLALNEALIRQKQEEAKAASLDPFSKGMYNFVKEVGSFADMLSESMSSALSTVASSIGSAAGNSVRTGEFDSQQMGIDMAATIVQQMVTQLVSQLIAMVVANTFLADVFVTNTSATMALTAAVTANTTALGGTAAVTAGAAGTEAVAAGGVGVAAVSTAASTGTGAAQTGALTANTAALAANTGGTAANTVGTATNTVGTATNTVSTATNTGATAANTGGLFANLWAMLQLTATMIGAVAAFIWELITTIVMLIAAIIVDIATPGATGGIVTAGATGGKVKAYKKGGPVLWGRDSSVPASDTVRAWLTPGELVVPVPLVEALKYGPVNFGAIGALLGMIRGNAIMGNDNSRYIRGFAEGGPVTAPTVSAASTGPTIVPGFVANENTMSTLLNSGATSMVRFLEKAGVVFKR